MRSQARHGCRSRPAGCWRRCGPGRGARALACALPALRSARDPRWVARRIEAKHPELGTGLLAAVEEVEAAPGGRLGFLQAAVIREALDHRRIARLGRDRAHLAAPRSPSWPTPPALRACSPSSSRLAIQARSQAVGGPRGALAGRCRPRSRSTRATPRSSAAARSWSSPASSAACRPRPAWSSTDEAQGHGPRGMTRSLEDPTFAGRVESVETDLAYRVEFDGQSTETYHVRVFEYPELERADAQLVFPRYTALEPKTVEDIRHVTAVEGTELTLLCRLNKDVATARLVDAEGQAIALDPRRVGSHTSTARRSRSPTRGGIKVKLVDREGRTNKLAAEIVVNVTRNRPPTVKMTQPAHDVQVSPLEELQAQGRARRRFRPGAPRPELQHRRATSRRRSS